MVKVFLDSESCNNIPLVSFLNYDDAKSFINGKLAEHIVECGRIYWTMERADDWFTVRIGNNFSTYRIEREV